MVRRAVKILVFAAAAVVRTASRRTLDAMFAGCGRTDLAPSYAYGLINEAMHGGMAINFAADTLEWGQEFDFNAGMIPHHAAAADMCDVYLVNASGAHGGIASLCYNITFGRKDWGEWQYDFSQPGEMELMLGTLEAIGETARYEAGCGDDAAVETVDGHEMDVGCAAAASAPRLDRRRVAREPRGGPHASCRWRAQRGVDVGLRRRQLGDAPEDGPERAL